MAQKNPLVLENGRLSQLPPGGTISGYTLSTITAGSGLVGGGDLTTGNKEIDVALAANASGLIYVGDSIGSTGADLAVANAALASGNSALTLYPTVAASGITAQSYANQALVSGNTALSAAVNAALYSNAVSLTAAATISGGSPVGIDNTGRAVPLQVLVSGSTNPPTFGSVEIIFNSLTSISYLSSTYDALSNRVYHLIGRTGAANTPAFVYQTEIFQNVSLYSTISGVVTSGNNTYPVIAAAPDIGYMGAFFNDIQQTRTTFNLAVYSGGDYRWQTNLTNNAIYNINSSASANNQLIYVPQKNTFVAAWASGTSGWEFTTPIVISDGQPVKGRNTQVSGANNVTTTMALSYNSVEDKLGYFCNNGTNNGVATVGTFSGDAILTTTSSLFSTTRVDYVDSAYSDKDNVFIVGYKNIGVSNRGYYTLGTVSGTPSGFLTNWTTPQVFESGITNYTKVLYENVNNKVVVAYSNASNSNYGTTRVGQISGAFINFDTSVVFRSAAVTTIAGAYDYTHNNVTLSFLNTTNSRVETVVYNHLADYRYTPVRSGVINYLGVAQSTVASGSPVTVILPNSIDYNQSNLSIGRDYYLDYYSGGFTPVSGVPPVWSGGSNWAPVGRAVSSSGLYLLRSI